MIFILCTIFVHSASVSPPKHQNARQHDDKKGHRRNLTLNSLCVWESECALIYAVLQEPKFVPLTYKVLKMRFIW